jgi:hypothetical protein
MDWQKLIKTMVRGIAYASIMSVRKETHLLLNYWGINHKEIV